MPVGFTDCLTAVRLIQPVDIDTYPFSQQLMLKRIFPILLASVAPAQSATIAIHPYECHQEIERKCAVGRAELICASPPARHDNVQNISHFED